MNSFTAENEINLIHSRGRGRSQPPSRLRTRSTSFAPCPWTESTSFDTMDEIDLLRHPLRPRTLRERSRRVPMRAARGGPRVRSVGTLFGTLLEYSNQLFVLFWNTQTIFLFLEALLLRFGLRGGHQCVRLHEAHVCVPSKVILVLRVQHGVGRQRDLESSAIPTMRPFQLR